MINMDMLEDTMSQEVSQRALVTIVSSSLLLGNASLKRRNYLFS